MGGLGYLEVLEDGAYKGPIDKFIPDDMKDEIRELAGLKALDTIFFIADNEKNASLYAGQIRTALGERLDLIEKNKFMFCYINDFPMYEYDNETKKMIFTHNPFSMPQGGLEALETKNPEEILAYQYDIVCNGVELSSGAVRNHDMKIMVKAFEIAGYTEEDLKEKFGALYNAFQFGAPPHAGMAPGVDRMIMLLREEENIREIKSYIHAPGYIANTDLAALYCGAFAFLYPSLRESFGIPMLEAMACGTPIIAGNTSAMPEIAGEGALLADPFNSNDITEKILQLENDQALYQQQVEYGIQRSQLFSWRNTAESLLKIYKEFAK